jgi:hypothetical protein
VTFPAALHDELFRRFDELDPNDQAAADKLFGDFGAGNMITGQHQPFERFEWYHGLLKLLFKRSREKYGKIHKGTPFFFLAWLSFDLRDYEKALTYLDAAISEDTRADPIGWRDRPGSRLLRLDPDPLHVGRRIIAVLRERLTEELGRFHGATGVSLKLTEFLDRVPSRLLATSDSRMIASAFYVFILEADERAEELAMRSIAGGSTGPAQSLLFRGGVLFESLLKQIYPGHSTLGAILHDSAFQHDFPGTYRTSAASLADILADMPDNSCETAFSTTARLRNTTGHNLIWDDVFADPTALARLIHQQFNALLLVIDRKF